jgi:hypothetical protein
MSRIKSKSHFIRHYAEMVAAMFLGMFVLMAPVGALLGAFGTSWSELSPAADTFAMAMTMAIPMGVWMRFRGHAWRANLEMVGAMLVPTLVVVPLLATHAVRNSGPVPVAEHAAMLAAMLIAMLVRRSDYSGAAHATA